jgi:hypothetical protein
MDFGFGSSLFQMDKRSDRGKKSGTQELRKNYASTSFLDSSLFSVGAQALSSGTEISPRSPWSRGGSEGEVEK